jgi:hypothetical protein
MSNGSGRLFCQEMGCRRHGDEGPLVSMAIYMRLPRRANATYRYIDRGRRPATVGTPKIYY